VYTQNNSENCTTYLCLQHKGLEGEQWYSSTLLLTFAPEEGGSATLCRRRRRRPTATATAAAAAATATATATTSLCYKSLHVLACSIIILAALPPGKRSSTHCTGWVHSTAGPYECTKSHPPWDSTP